MSPFDTSPMLRPTAAPIVPPPPDPPAVAPPPGISTNVQALSSHTRDITPHLIWPLRLAPDGTPGLIDQDTPEEHAQAVALTLWTPVGSLIDSPAFGSPDPTFLSRMPASALEAHVQGWEPRVSQQLVSEGVQQRVGTLDINVGGPRG